MPHFIMILQDIKYILQKELWEKGEIYIAYL